MMILSPPTRRRLLRFNLRALLIFVAAIAIWFAYYLHWMDERREVRAWIDAHGTDGALDYSPQGRSGLPWMLWLLGEKPVNLIVTEHSTSVRDYTHIPPEHQWLVRRVMSLFPEAEVVDNEEAMFGKESVIRSGPRP
jgi:hypothetical protein